MKLINKHIKVVAVLLLQTIGFLRADNLLDTSLEENHREKSFKSLIEKNNNDPTSYFEENSLEKYFDNKITFDEYLSFSMEALKLIAGFDNDLHRYDSNVKLINSFARNLSYADDLSDKRARIDSSEISLLQDQSELTLIENEQNQLKCEKELNYLLKESQQLFSSSENYSKSKQLNMIDFFDSFGSPMSQLMMGNLMWLGSHEQCFKSKLIYPNELNIAIDNRNNVPLKGRYCIANFQSPNWTIENYDSTYSGGNSIKIGICLPESCNSLSILRHGQLIESLIKQVRFNQVPYNNYSMRHLFCLPDEKSPLRQFSLSAMLFIILISSWLTLIICMSLKYEYLRMKSIYLDRDNYDDDDERETKVDKLMKVFALRLSWNSLFYDKNSNKNRLSCNKQSSQQTQDNIPKINQPDDDISFLATKDANILESLHHIKNHDNFMPNIKYENNIVQVLNNSANPLRNDAQLQKQTSKQQIKLSAIDGIKVLSMIWLISAHTLLFFIRTISNGRQFWSILRDVRFLTIMAGIFPVDTFFTITGVLTAYLKFNKNDGIAMKKLNYWLEAFVHRYLRFMPMYLIIFWYTRDVSEYIGSGPLWDYATAETSLRSVCKQESITVPLFFKANFKPLDQHCVKPAWYLANDYQFLLITPIFMFLLMKSKLLGYSIIALSIIVSLILQFTTVYYSNDLTDFSALINFKPMFATYVLKNLWQLYVLPYNRIPPYLIGIINGHLMYNLNKQHQEEKTKIIDNVENIKIRPNKSHDSLSSTSSLSTTATSLSHHASTSKILRTNNIMLELSYIDMIKSYIYTNVWTPLVLLISIIYLPMISKLFTHEGLVAKIGTSCIIELMRLVWSLAIARLIFVCATHNLRNNNNNKDSFIIRFLSSEKWKPWSKIGLSALLIQWEIISYLAQTQSTAPNLTITFLLATILICIVTTYLLALIIYLIIEYPLSQVEHLYIHPTLFRKAI